MSNGSKDKMDKKSHEDIAEIVIENIKERWSCRLFNSEPVPRDVIEILLKAANHAPSPMNTQPWEFIVLTGKPLLGFHDAITEWLKSPEKSLDKQDEVAIIPGEKYYTTLPKHLVARKREFLSLVSEEVEKMGFSLKDVYKNTYYFHYAPVIILVIGDSVKRNRHGLEIHQGLAAAIQNILLVAHARGCGTCWIGDIMRFGKLLNEHLGLEMTKEVAGGVALGYPNTDLIAELDVKNVSKRSLEGKIDWRGF